MRDRIIEVDLLELSGRSSHHGEAALHLAEAFHGAVKVHCRGNTAVLCGKHRSPGAGAGGKVRDTFLHQEFFSSSQGDIPSGNRAHRISVLCKKRCFSIFPYVKIRILAAAVFVHGASGKEHLQVPALSAAAEKTDVHVSVLHVFRSGLCPAVVAVHAVLHGQHLVIGNAGVHNGLPGNLKAAYGKQGSCHPLTDSFCFLVSKQGISEPGHKICAVLPVGKLLDDMVVLVFLQAVLVLRLIKIHCGGKYVGAIGHFFHVIDGIWDIKGPFCLSSL